MSEEFLHKDSSLNLSLTTSDIAKPVHTDEADPSLNPFVAKSTPPKQKSKFIPPPINNSQQPTNNQHSTKRIPSPSFSPGHSLHGNQTLKSSMQKTSADSKNLSETNKKTSTQQQKADRLEKHQVLDQANSPSKGVALSRKSNSLPSHRETEGDENVKMQKQNSCNINDDSGKVIKTEQSQPEEDPVPKNSLAKIKMSLNKVASLDSEASNIPLNLQMLKEKFKTFDAKALKHEGNQELKSLSQIFSAGKTKGKDKSDETKSKMKTESDNIESNEKKSDKNQGGEQSNWLYKKFAEAALTKKEELLKKSSILVNSKKSHNTNEDEKIVSRPSPEKESKGVSNVQGSNKQQAQQQSKSTTTTSKAVSQCFEDKDKSLNVSIEVSPERKPGGSILAQNNCYMEGQKDPTNPAVYNQNHLNTNQTFNIGIPPKDYTNILNASDISNMTLGAAWPANLQVGYPVFNPDERDQNKYQKNIISIIGFYEQHLNNFKTIIIKQNGVIESQRQKIISLEDLLKESNNRIKALEEQLQNQMTTDRINYQDLLDKYNETVVELKISKTNLEKALKKLGEYSLLEDTFERRTPDRMTPNAEPLNFLHQELYCLKKDLDMQKEIMKEFKQKTFTPPHLDYQYDNMTKSAILIKNEQNRNEYDPLDKQQVPLEKNTYSAYNNRPSSNSVPRLGNYRDRGNFHQNADEPSRDRHNKVISSNRIQLHENSLVMLQNRQKARGTQAKEAMAWGSPRKTSDSNYNPQKGASISQNESFYEGNSRIEFQNLISVSGRGSARSNSSEPRFPAAINSSFEKEAKDKDKITRIQQIMRERNMEKKSIENELFKMPAHCKTLEQKRKKANLEMELEKIEEEIEGYKNTIRDMTVYQAKQR